MVEVADFKLLNNDLEHLSLEVDDHEQRLRLLEKAHWRMIGWVSFASAIAAAGGSVVVAFLK